MSHREYKKIGFGLGNIAEGRFIRKERHLDNRRAQRAKRFNSNRDLDHLAFDEQSSPVPVENQAAHEDRYVQLEKWKKKKELEKKMQKQIQKPVFKPAGPLRHKFYSPPKTLAANPKELATHVTGKICKHRTKTETPPRRVTRATEKRRLEKLAAAQKHIPKSSSSSRKQVAANRRSHVEKVVPTYDDIPLFGRVAVNPITKEFRFVMPMVTQTPHQNQNQNQNERQNENQNQNQSLNENQNPGNDSSIEAVDLHLSEDSSSQETTEDKENTPSNARISFLRDSEPKTTPKLEPEPVAMFSPYVITSRGKSNARKEQQLRRGLGKSPMDNDDVPTKDTVMQKLNISVEEEEKTAKYFRFVLNREVERLTELCDKWESAMSDPSVPEDSQYRILQVVGQTKLLLAKKFERFRSLVNECELGKGERLVMCRDLQGFWDMTYMEVEDCDKRFQELEELRTRNWVETEAPKLGKPEKKRPMGTKKPPKKVPIKSSGLRALIAAKRRNQGKQQIEEPIKDESEEVPDRKEASRRRSMLLTPMRKEQQQGSRRSIVEMMEDLNVPTLIKTPLMVMKVSQMCKPPEVKLDESISYVNSTQTPAKGILKRAEESLPQKSAQKVNFDDRVVLNEVPVDEERANKMDLAAALAMIDSYEGQDFAVNRISAERKLDFENESFDEDRDPVEPCEAAEERDLKESSSGNESGSSEDSLLRELRMPARKDVGAVNQEKEEEEEEEEELGVRVLRNRMVHLTPNSRRSKAGIDRNFEVHEPGTPTQKGGRRRSSRRKSQSERNVNEKLLQDEEKESVQDKDEGFHQEESQKVRRSTRKSVRFNAEDCSGCTPMKPSLPRTPRARRSKSHHESS